jgi:hypothetical protein
MSSRDTIRDALVEAVYERYVPSAADASDAP